MISVCFCLFRNSLFLLFIYRFETPKQTENLLFLVSRNKPKHNRNKDLVSVCFGSNRIFFRFEDTGGAASFLGGRPLEPTAEGDTVRRSTEMISYLWPTCMVKVFTLLATTRDGILVDQFEEKKLESFAPCYSPSILLADFKNTYKKVCETRKLEFIHE